GRDRSHLREHVLTAVVDSRARAQHRLANLRDVPRKTNARLKLLLRTRQRAVRRKARIVQEDAVSRCARRHHRIRKDLCFPTQTVVEREVGTNSPRVLSEHCEVFILDVRRARGVSCWTSQARALQIKQQRTASSGCSHWTGSRCCHKGAVGTTDGVW